MALNSSVFTRVLNMMLRASDFGSFGLPSFFFIVIQIDVDRM